MEEDNVNNTTNNKINNNISNDNTNHKKYIILIRHAESQNNLDKKEAKTAWSNIKNINSLPTWNQLCSAASLLSIPMDTDLSSDGAIMLTNLTSKLKEANFIQNHEVELVVHSPLIRARRTCMELFSDYSGL
jgi:broad specificity phosphatase PhoE